MTPAGIRASRRRVGARANRWCARADAGLLAVVVGYVVVQLAAVGVHAALGWDEAIYVSQFGRAAPPAWFGAPRARGITLLPAPVVAGTGSTIALRVWMALLSAAVLYAVFRVWLRVCEPKVVSLAAAGFAALWVTEYYGDQVMPNLYVALGAVAAAGFAVRALREQRLRPALAAGAWIAWVALVRPSDGIWLTAGMVVGVAIAAGRRSLRLAAALVGGLVAGSLEWVVEALVRFGGVATRVHEAGTQNATGLTFSLPMYARAVNGPILCRPCAGHRLMAAGAAWWLIAAALVVIAVIDDVRVGDARRWWVPVAGAVGVAAGYLLLIDYAAPRFLLPTYALLSLPAAGGAVVVGRWATRSGHGRAVTGLAVAVVAVFLAEQAAVLAHQVRSRSALDRINARVVAVLHAAGVVDPCTVAGPVTFQIVYAAGCHEDFDVLQDLRHGDRHSVDEGDDAGDRQSAAAMAGSPRGYALVVPISADKSLPATVRRWRHDRVGRRYDLWLPRA